MRLETKNVVQTLLEMGCTWRNEKTLDLKPVTRTQVRTVLKNNKFFQSKVRLERWSCEYDSHQMFYLDSDGGFLQILSV